MKAALTLVASALSLYTASATYPVVMWAEPSSGNAQPSEIKTPTSFADFLSNSYKQSSQGKTNTVVFVKDGLTSADLANDIASFPYIKSKILDTNSVTYTNIVNGFDFPKFAESLHAHQTYELSNAAEASALSAKVLADLRSTNALFKVSLIRIDEAVPTGALDSIVATILKPAEKQDGNLLAVVAGAPSKTVSSDAALNLAEIQSLQQTQTTLT